MLKTATANLCEQTGPMLTADEGVSGSVSKKGHCGNPFAPAAFATGAI